MTIPQTARVDHVLVAVPDLDASVTRWRAAGLRPVIGGRHPGGTVNALIRGPQRAYIELISASDPDGDAATRRVAATHGPVGWAIGVGDIQAARQALAAQGIEAGPVYTGSRTTPDGELLAWRLCDIAPRVLDAVVPFLIQWDVAMPPGPADGPRLTEVTVGTSTPRDVATILTVCGLAQTGGVGDTVTLSDGVVTVRLAPDGEGIRAITLDAVAASVPVRLDNLEIT